MTSVSSYKILSGWLKGQQLYETRHGQILFVPSKCWQKTPAVKKGFLTDNHSPDNAMNYGLHSHSGRQRGPLSEQKELHHLTSSENKVGGVLGLPVPKEIIFELWKTGQSLFWAGELWGLCVLVPDLDAICCLLLDLPRTCAANIFPCSWTLGEGRRELLSSQPQQSSPPFGKSFHVCNQEESILKFRRVDH